MRMNQISNTRNRHSVNLKKRIARNRFRAKIVGLLYLIATIALTALAFMPLFDGAVSFLGTSIEFTYDFNGIMTAIDNLSQESPLGDATKLIYFLCIFLYAAMLLSFIINVLRSISKLKWLFKKKASRTYGFNRNVYAMSMMGDRFAGTFGGVLTFYYLFSLLGAGSVNSMLYIALGIGLAVHFICGFLGGNTKLFHIEAGYGITEQERDTSRFVPFVRSFLQVASAFALAYLFLVFSGVGTLIPALYVEEGFINMDLFNSLDIMAMISVFLQIFLMITVISLMKRAVSPVEFGIEGRFGEGIKKFRIGCLFALLFAIGIYVCRMMFGEVVFTVNNPSMTYEVVMLDQIEVIYFAAVAGVMFLIELLLRKRPRTAAEKGETTEAMTVEGAADGGAAFNTELGDDVDMDYYFNNCVMYPGIYYAGYEQNNGYSNYRR